MVLVSFFVLNVAASSLYLTWIYLVQFWIQSIASQCFSSTVFLGFVWLLLFAYFFHHVRGNTKGGFLYPSSGKEHTLFLFGVMGNDTSSIPSEANTPVSPSSEWQSVYSVGSKKRASICSTRLPSPVEPPEPDLSHLSEDEIRTIRSVIGRAKTMQQEEQQRIRELEEDYIAHASTVGQRALSVEAEKPEVHLCPICLKNELSVDDPPGVRSGQNICNDCGVLTCSECGAFQGSMTSKLQEWVCVVCGKRRKLVFSTGLWHPGVDPSEDVPLERELQSQLEKLKTEDRPKPPMEKAMSTDHAPKRPPLPRQKSLPIPDIVPKVTEKAVSPQKPVASQSSLSGRSDVTIPEGSESEDYATFPAKPNSKFGSALWNMMGSCARGPIGRSARSRSDSESSDVTSDVDMVDVSMQYQQGEPISPDDGSDDYSMMSIGSSGEDSLKRRPKHRPRSLSIPRSQSATSSDDETSDSNVSTDTECRLAQLDGMDGGLVARAASAFAEEMEDFKSHDPWKELQIKPEAEVHEDMKKRSPYAPRSPSWREGLESPPFSPRRRDSYPGKKRGSPTRSPKDRHHFTFPDTTSPNAKQPQSETDALFEAEYPDTNSEFVHSLEEKNAHGYAANYGKERQKDQSGIVDYECEPRIIARIPESTACMDLATYAATIASNTANLTQMSVSPTNLNAHDRDRTLSPDSQGSNGSVSPISPGYYEHGTIPEEDEDEEEVELADPSSKSIDYQGSKRQKARPPSTDWSPVIDLSPILDVSPSIEEAEQEDMLVMQEQERRRRESQEEDTSGDESKHYFQPVKEEDDLKSFYGLKRYNRVEDICKLLDVPASEFEDIKTSPDSQAIVSHAYTADSVQSMITTAEQLSTMRGATSSTINATDSLSKVALDSKTKLNTSTVSSSSRPKPDNIDGVSPSSDKSDGKSDSKTKESKTRRKLPEPTADMIAQHSRKKKPLPALPPTTLHKEPENEKKNKNYATVIIPERKFTAAASKSLSESNPAKSLKEQVQKQDSEERRRRAKDLKAKPDPLLIQHIESEEKSLSPQYKVLDSPPSPESRSSLKRDYSDSTSVSPSSSPDRELYPFPSPVTPPDSDSSPPKPHSPSSTGTDNFDEDGELKERTSSAEAIYECIFPVPSGKSDSAGKVPPSKGRKKADQYVVDGKKVRRKLPPLPPEEAGATPPPIPPKPKSYSSARRNSARQRSGYVTPSSTSDESMNEEDFEVAMLTKQRRMNDLDKPSLDRWNGNYLPPDMDDSKVKKNVKQMYNEDVKANIPPNVSVEIDRAMDQFNREKDETDQIIDSMITIYGVPITQAMKSLKKRLQEELRRATEGRRRRIEEIEEIRALQAQICELKLSQDYAKVQAKRSAQKQAPAKSTGPGGKKRGSVPMAAPRSSPQVMPRRSRHKRQSSDPMISKFSPIKEDKDIEADFQLKTQKSNEEPSQKYITDDSSQSGLSDNESIRSEPAFNSRVKKIKPSAYTDLFFNQQDPRRKPNIEPSTSLPSLPPKCHSDTNLPEKGKSHNSVYVSDDEESKAREDRKYKLQQEIEKRKKKLEETTKLKTELFDLTRSGQVMAHSYDDIPKKSSRSYSLPRPIPTGIIKPLEDEDDFDDASDDNEFVTRSHQEINKASVVDSNDANYSSSEYLAHKQESVRRRLEDVTSYSSPYLFTGNINDPRGSKSTKQKVDFYLDPSSRDVVITSSVTLPDLHSRRSDIEYPCPKDYGAVSDTETSPPSDSTPAMPLLDDVKERSRQIIHGIGTGSRPVSAEFNFSGGVEDLMNGMHRVESDNSVDADEPIMKHMMEGGVTILKQKERKKQPPPPQPKVYDFPIKRILLTRDPKDRSIKAGNGLGMKIVGGRTIPGTKTVGAYVAAIYQGGVAEQLLGELQEGDQILEWNGIDLSDKTYEEVQAIICQPNGEIELVVRPAPHRAARSKGEESYGSSYDNFEFVSDDVYEKCVKSNHGVDARQLAAQLEGINDSPNASQSSSQHEYFSPSVSSPCSSPRSDPASVSSERQRGTSSDDRSQRTSLEERQARACLEDRSTRNHSQERPQRSSLQERSQRSNSKERSRRTVMEDKMSRSGNDSRSQKTSLDAKGQRASLEKSPRPSPRPSPRQSVEERKKQMMAVEEKVYPGRSPEKSDSLDRADKSTQQEDRYWGEIQLQLSHDELASNLHIHVIQARNLKPRDINGLSDPFVKIYLLPGRCSENKRRTKHISRTLNPEWHQKVTFQDVHHEEVKYKTLEITVWDYDRFKANDFLGEVVIDLSVEGFLNDEPHWYPLQDHDPTRGVELPKPTVLPPTGKTSDARKNFAAQSVYRTSRDSPNMQRRKSDKPDNMGRRRRSLGNLSDVDRV
uniref:Protein piccolo-like isoform X3 n=1 Tax=Crassostrea virginica TaxID=6565 RepID=A0A8B8B969_CRAVI|nr:protein piccolo-like isoform X3 [Crassostrea virginica]